MELEEQAVIVLDVGTYSSKCGFAGDDAPRAVFKTQVGRPRVAGIMVGLEMRDAYVGTDAVSNRGVLDISYPVQNRTVTNWDDMTKIWHNAFYQELQVAPEEHPVLLSEPPLTSDKDKEQVMELMFEDFSVPAYYGCMAPALGLFATGATTGLAVDSGEGGTHTVPVYEGYSCVHAINSLKFSGEALTRHLRDLLDERGYSFTTPKDLDIVRDIKERLCYISEDYSTELKNEEESAQCDMFYELPSKHTILVKGERFKSAEALFKPELFGIKDDGIHHKVFQSIMKCDQDIRKDMYSKILLVGGTTLLPGLKERLRKEVLGLAPVGTRPQVVDPPEREYSVWEGGSILASLNTFHHMCITKEKYEEHGFRIIHYKC